MEKIVSVLGKDCRVTESFIVRLEGEDVNGLFDPDSFHITIQANLKKEIKERAELHELGHALLTRLGLVDVIDGNLQELIVEGYANFLQETFKLKYKNGTGSRKHIQK